MVQPDPAFFPLADLRWALAWSALTRCLGWWLVVADAEDCECVTVLPPSARTPSSRIIPRGQSVLMTRLQPGNHTESSHISLREALLTLHPMTAAQLNMMNRPASTSWDIDLVALLQTPYRPAS